MGLELDFTDEGQLRLQGSFNDLQMGQILVWLFQEQQTGELTLTTPQFEQKIYVEEGKPVGIRGGPQEDFLGWLLMERDIISNEVYLESLRRMTAQQQPQGQILLAMKAIRPVELKAVLTIQLQRKLVRLFREPEARFVFLSQATPTIQDIPAGSLNIYTVLSFGLRQNYEKTRLQNILQPLTEKAILLKPETEWSCTPEELRLEDDEASALPLLSKWTTIEQFIQRDYLDETPALICIAILYTADCLHIDEKSKRIRRRAGASAISTQGISVAATTPSPRENSPQPPPTAAAHVRPSSASQAPSQAIVVTPNTNPPPSPTATKVSPSTNPPPAIALATPSRSTTPPPVQPSP